MPEQQTAALRHGREGGRWVNERPTPEEFATWFETSMKLDPALKHEDYIGGVVLIPTVDERARYVSGFTNEGHPIIDIRPELNYTPYAKVETRIAYFWDLVAQNGWKGEIKSVTSPRMPIDFITEEETREDGSMLKRRVPGAMTVLVHQLPDGFSIMSVPVGQGYSHFICHTVEVAIYATDRDGNKQGEPLRTGRGTKQVPLLAGRDRPYADANSLMKAETGAKGRALGFAGIFIIPGSGVATAEDMLEALAQGTTPAQTEPSQGPATPEAPLRTGAEQQAATEEELRAKAVTLWKALSEESPEKAEEFGAWMRERGHANFGDVKGAAIRGVVKKLERLSTDAERQPTLEEGSDGHSAETAAESGAAAS